MASRGAHRITDEVRIPVTVWVPATMHAQLRAIAKANRMDPEQVGPILVEAARRHLNTPSTDSTPAPARKRRERWTDDHTAQLRELHAQGLSDSEIGRRIGKHQTMVSSKRRTLGLPRNHEPGFQRIQQKQNAASIDPTHPALVEVSLRATA